MASKLFLVGFMLAVAATLFISCTALSHTVGDIFGWNIPPFGDSGAYQTWAASQNFSRGDSITFQWFGTHDVVQVTENGYDNCDASGNNARSPVQTTSPVTFTLNSNGPHYYICTVGNHCSLGQKVAIQVGRRRESGGGSSIASPSLIKTGAFFTIVLTALFAILF